MKFAYFSSHSCHDEAESPRETILQAREQMKLADEAGFETIWFPEHHFVRSFSAPGPLLHAVDAAHRVKNARVGTAVVATTFQHPLMIAGQVGLADQLTDGRLEAGFARSGSMYEFARFGITETETVELNLECMEAVIKLLRGENVS